MRSMRSMRGGLFAQQTLSVEYVYIYIHMCTRMLMHTYIHGITVRSMLSMRFVREGIVLPGQVHGWRW
jgi:hypothetical protein